MSGIMVFYTLIICHMIIQFHIFSLQECFIFADVLW